MCCRKILIFVFAVLLASCVPSLHPLYTDKDVIFEPKLLGVWDDSNDTGIWEFRAGAEPNSYEMIYTDKEKKSGSFQAHLVKLDEMLFLDVYPNDPNCQAGSSYNKMLLVPAHTFLKVEQIEPTLKWQFMDVDKIQKHLEKDPKLLKHELVLTQNKETKVILTASTKELQDFMRKHANEDWVFGKAVNMKRMAKSKSEGS
jgi:hypothetical protein